MKKSLALVLVLTMIIGMMAIPASAAASFTDEDTITYKQAVEVVEMIGVINGFEDGSFDPQGDLTREQAAKLIAYMLLGTSKADKLTTNIAPFTDVEADRWSAGYIAFCQSQGIIAGRGDGTFDPEATVTGYEFAKMLLVTLGYDAEIEEMTGAAWAINVAKLAIKIDLFDGNEAADFNSPANREEATLYVFNMLLSDIVDYASRGVEIETTDGTTVIVGASTAASEPNAEDDDYRYQSNTNKGGADEFLQFCEEYFKDLTVDEAEDDSFGRPGELWKYDGDDIGTYVADAVLTYTEKVSAEDVYDDLDEPDSSDVIKYEVNGDDLLPNTGIELETSNADFGGQGTLTEVFEDGDDYIITEIDTFVGYISDWTEADEDDEVEESVEISNYYTADTIEFETVKFSEEDAEEETIVLVTAYVNNSGDYVIDEVIEAESIDVEVTETDGDFDFSVDDDDYTLSRYWHNVTKNGSDNLKYEEEATIYLDMYGNPILATEIEETEKNYAMVLAATGEKNFSTYKYEAQMLTTEGDIEIVEIDEDSYEKILDGTLPTNTTTETNDAKATIVTYTEDDGIYEFKAVTDSDVIPAGSTFKVENGKTAVTVGGDADQYRVSSSTKFIIDLDDSASKFDIELYEGYNDVINLEGNAQVGIITNGSIIDYMFAINAEDAGATAKDMTLVLLATMSDEISNSTGTYYEFDAVVEGEITTIKVDSDYYDTATDFEAAVLAGEKFFMIEEFDVDSKDVIDNIVEATEDTNLVDGLAEDMYGVALGNGAASDDVVEFGGYAQQYDANNTRLFIVDGKDIEADDIDRLKAGDDNNIVFTVDEDGILVDVFVFENLEAADAFAKERFVVKFMNGNDVMSTQTVVLGDVVTIPDTTMTGYAFDGWYSDKDFANPVTPEPKAEAKDVTYYAEFTAITYEIEYVNATSNTQTYTSVPTTDTAVFGGEFILPEAVEFVDGTVTGFALTAGGSTIGAPEAKVDIDADFIQYAVMDDADPTNVIYTVTLYVMA